MRSTLPLIIFAAALLQSGRVVAQIQKHPKTPVGVTAPRTSERAVLPEQTVRIPGLKAVMLGGEVDGVGGKDTVQYTNYLKRVAKVLRDRGVNVVEFYSPTTKEKVKQAVQGAHFLVYAGHGIGDSNAPSYQAEISPGGMLVLEGVWVGRKEIQEWQPAKGAVIIYIGACFTAGNAGTDMGKIDAAEARRRVSVYSKPLMEGGKFSGYYATWSDATAQTVVAHLFSGRTLGESYDPSGKFTNVARLKHPDFNDRDMWIRTNKYPQGTVFDFAFAGNSDRTLARLFGGSDNPSDNKPTEAKPDPEKDKALLRAVYSGQTRQAEEALAGGADPNAQSKGWSALLLSVYFDRREMVGALLKRKADLNAEIEGYNALALAEAYERTQIVQMLKAAGAVKSRAVPAKKPVAPR